VSWKKTVGNARRTKVKLHHVTDAASLTAATDERGRGIGGAITEVTDIGQKAIKSADGELTDRVGTVGGKDNLIGKSQSGQWTGGIARIDFGNQCAVKGCGEKWRSGRCE